MAEYDLFNLGLTTAREKKKLHAKVFSLDGILTSIGLINFEIPEIRFSINWTMILTTLIDYWFSIILGLDLELDQFDIDFLNIVLPEIEWDITMPAINIVLPDFQDIFNATIIQKGVYGKTKYDYSYYDPQFTIRHMAYEVKHALVKHGKEYSVSQILTGVDINPRLADFMHYVIRIGQDIIEQNFIMGTNMLNYSRLRKRGSNTIKVKYTWHEAGQPEIKYDRLDQVVFGIILGISRLSMARFMPREQSVVDHTFRKLPATRGRRVLNDFTGIRHALKIGEYGKGSVDLFFSKKAERYCAFRTLARQVRSLVKNIVKGKVDNPFDINKYQNAGVELALAYYKRSNKLSKRVKDVDIEYLKKYWINKWSAWGLNLNLLETIFNVVESLCQSLRNRKQFLE